MKKRLNADTLYLSKEFIGLQCFLISFETDELREMYKKMMHKYYTFQDMFDENLFIVEAQLKYQPN